MRIDVWLIQVRAREKSQDGPRIVKNPPEELTNDQAGIWGSIKPPEHYLDNLGIDDAIANRI